MDNNKKQFLGAALEQKPPQSRAKALGMPKILVGLRLMSSLKATTEGDWIRTSIKN